MFSELSELSRLFVPERHHRRAGDVGFSVPALLEMSLEVGVEPLLVTNMRGSFVPTRVSSLGYARCGMSECPIDQEHCLVRAFFSALWEVSVKQGWTNRASTVQGALQLLIGLGSVPKVVLLSEDAQPDPYDPTPGVNSLPVVYSKGLEFGTALVVGPPQSSGLYTRIGDHVGVLAQRVNTAFVMVGS